LPGEFSAILARFFRDTNKYIYVFIYIYTYRFGEISQAAKMKSKTKSTTPHEQLNGPRAAFGWTLII